MEPSRLDLKREPVELQDQRGMGPSRSDLQGTSVELQEQRDGVPSRSDLQGTSVELEEQMETEPSRPELETPVKLQESSTRPASASCTPMESQDTATFNGR